MSVIRMHVQRTDDPDALDWVVRDGLVCGTASFRPGDEVGLGSLPSSLAALLSDRVLSRIVISDGRIRVWRAGEKQWDELAPIVQSAIASALADGGQIRLASLTCEGFEVQRSGLCKGCPSAGIKITSGIGNRLC